MFLHRPPLVRIGALAIVAACVALALPALAADLTVGLGTDVTSIDPHYHNLTPNSNVAAHIFGYLVQRTKSRSSSPGSRPSGRPSTRSPGSSSCVAGSSSTTDPISP